MTRPARGIADAAAPRLEMTDVSKYRLQLWRRDFCRLDRPADLAMLLGMSPQRLTAMALYPEYRHFTIPKKGGGTRHIEEPVGELKEVQEVLNTYLQAVYWFCRTDAAYGFLMRVKGEAEPRHIVTHARRHMGCKYLLNADVKDCFHQISTEEIQAIFEDKPFHFGEALARLLAALCTHQGRLPMGAPTSPVLSNFAMRLLDKSMEALARMRGWIYTRYADDLSFSSQEVITEVDIQQVSNLAVNHGFPFNPAKVTLMGPDDVKVVTGLVVGIHEVALPPSYIEEFYTHTRTLAGIVGVEAYFHLESTLWARRFEQKLHGMLEFAGQVLGTQHPEYRKMVQALRRASEPPDSAELFSWLDFPYR